MLSQMNGTKTGKPTLAEVGRDAARKAQREALLKELDAQDWNLSATARELGLTNVSNVLRAIKNLGLEKDYDNAKAAGKIHPGRPT